MIVKKKEPDVPAQAAEEEVLEYIRTVRLRRKLMGIDEAELWAVLSNIQRYYAVRERERRAAEQAEKAYLQEQLREREQEVLSLKKKLILALKGAGHGISAG
ncbi:MAG: hypothetical protein IJH75_01565 [Mogibacterium sp.]|nr:hypothetical protein [Mogibacterium sp.]